VALGQVFSEYFGIPCQSSFHQPLHNHHRSSGAGTIGQQWPTYQVDSVSPHPKKLTKNYTPEGTTLQDNRCVSQDSNRALAMYKAESLPLEPIGALGAGGDETDVGHTARPRHDPPTSLSNTSLSVLSLLCFVPLPYQRRLYVHSMEDEHELC
jgi:hypothetical protein